MKFDRRVALVTGAGAGIGRTIAAALGREGARILIADRANAEAAAAELRDAGIDAHNILVNAIAPGFTLSENVENYTALMSMVRGPSIAGRALARDMYPQDVAGAAVFFSGPDCGFITGQTLAACRTWGTSAANRPQRSIFHRLLVP